MTVMEQVDHEFLLPFWKVHVLHHAESGELYGLWMLQELAEHGYAVSPGTLYPLLARMERNGWLTSSSAGASKARRSYRITPEGRRVLRTLRRAIVELHDEVVATAPRAAKRAGRRPPKFR
jgi:PadR family transcriptional regulator, regulatory protein PadR